MRPTVSHSWAHRNMIQNSPWMEYSGNTSYIKDKQEEEEESEMEERRAANNSHFKD